MTIIDQIFELFPGKGKQALDALNKKFQLKEVKDEAEKFKVCDLKV